MRCFFIFWGVGASESLKGPDEPRSQTLPLALKETMRCLSLLAFWGHKTVLQRWEEASLENWF